MRTRIRIKNRGNGSYLGEIVMPLKGGGHIIVGAIAQGDTHEELGFPGYGGIRRAARKIGGRAKALKKVATIARRVYEDPIAKALMPAQVTSAIKAATALSKVAQKRGSKYMKKIAPHLPAAQKAIAKALAKDGLPAAQPIELVPARLAPGYAPAPAAAIAPEDEYFQAYEDQQEAGEDDQLLEYGEEYGTEDEMIDEEEGEYHGEPE